MPDPEEVARQEAVMRALSGEPPGKVAADMGRSERWVRKWVARYDPTDESWDKSQSRAPNTVANRTPEETERLVLEIRERLMKDPLGASWICGDRVGDAKLYEHPATREIFDDYVSRCSELMVRMAERLVRLDVDDTGVES